MKKILLVLFFVGVFIGMMIVVRSPRSSVITPQQKLKEQYSQKVKPSVDHSLFPELKKKFNKPQEVTAACISCHNGRAAEVMKSTHWKWDRLEYIPGKGIRHIGKKNKINNYCIGIAGNEYGCNKCHIGFGYDNPKFDFNNPLNVDCLSCHDNSDTYLKASGSIPDKDVNLNLVAQNVGKPKRTNCGTCHFFGGGGNNVKHGDLEEALFATTREVDVHMGTDGIDMQCVDCHTAEKHQMLGKSYSLSSMNRNRVECEKCHSQLPHTDDILNSHTLKVACQTCHIPIYAKVHPTELYRDWSVSGKLKDGKPYEEHDSSGVLLYSSERGAFTWGKEIKPDYIWFNGTASHYFLGDTINPTELIKINQLYGSYDDPDSKIYPVKIHRAKVPYDKENKYLIQLKTISLKSGDGGFWKEFNWVRASEEGMKLVNLPFSGKLGFVETEMYWPINHMVSPKNQTVECKECHTRENGRLANLTGFYLPGRDYNPWVEAIGGGLVIFTLAGVIAHGSIRIITSRTRKENN